LYFYDCSGKVTCELLSPEVVMATIRVVTDTAQYQKQLRTSGPNRYREVTEAELRTLGPDA
jgi:hypothetical protein